ncbi:MAG: hypothetical protein EBV15_01350 [Bacteroidetes bacterium]|nr:hypothetical protein [Bacteroidota bacterium]
MKTGLLLFTIGISCSLFTSNLNAQSEPLSGGVGVGPGTIFNLPGKTGKATTLGLRFDGRIPLLTPYISHTMHAGWEYALMRVESNAVGNTLQTARAQYLRAGISLNIRLYTSSKNTGLELGGGLLFRKKFYESSDWQLTGGQPITYFPKNQTTAPVQLIRFSENDKRRMNIFAEVVFNTETGNNAINGISAGIQWQWFAKQRKQYFKGTHRTLQWDDIWPAQVY